MFIIGGDVHMKKRFLGIVCLIYSLIIIFIWTKGILGNFIAPNMQIYIKSSVIPLIVIGIVLLIDNKIKYNFKISDLVLLVPILFLLFVGDGNLSMDIAKIKATAKNKNNIENIDDGTTDYIVKDDKIEEFYFDIEDSNYSYIADYLPYTSGARKFIGKTIRAQGIAVDFSEYFTDEYFSIGRYTITCCAADAEFTGFVVIKPDFKIEYGKWYEVEGYLELGKDIDGDSVMVINPVSVKKISGKGLNQNVYSCEAYGKSACRALLKYDFEY